MRFVTVSGVVMMLMVVCFSPCKTAAAQYVQISEPFVNVYQYLDPKSPVVKMAKKGDRLELILDGPSWYNVKIGNETGWVERKAGFVVDHADVMAPVVSIILIVLVLAGTIYGVSFYIRKNKTA